MKNDEYFTTFEAAEMLKVSRSTLQSARTLRRWHTIKNLPKNQRDDCCFLERIPYYKSGSKVLYHISDLKKYLNKLLKI